MTTDNHHAVKHIAPRFYEIHHGMDDGRWVQITVCTKCGQRAARTTVHPVTPCPACGSMVEETTGRWIIDSKPKKGVLWRFLPTMKLSTGHWELHPITGKAFMIPMPLPPSTLDCPTGGRSEFLPPVKPPMEVIAGPSGIQVSTQETVYYITQGNQCIALNKAAAEQLIGNLKTFVGKPPRNISM